MKTTILPAAVVFVLSNFCSHGAVIFTEVQSSGENAYVANASATDLINSGTITLASSTVATSYDGVSWNGAGLNDGVAGTVLAGHTALYGLSPGNFPAVSTFNLNVSTATLGYDITSLTSIAGWNHASIGYGDQKFTVEYSVVGSASYTTLFANHNFGTLAGIGSTMVTATDSSGVLASGVDSIRITYFQPTASSRSVIQEFDVTGIATVPEPSSVLLGGLGLLALLRRRR